VIPLVALLALPVDSPTGAAPFSGELFDPVVARGAHMAPGEAKELSKKEEWLREKALRPDFHVSDADLERYTSAASSPAARHAAARRPGAKPAARVGSSFHCGERIEPVTTLFNVWTHEALPILPGESVESRFHTFLRDHYTNQATHMDTRLVGVLTNVANKFSAKRIEVVSGYRSPKYNLMLRKKGHQVARHSQHMEGTAVDFRIRGVATKQILYYVRSLRLGGVGFYPHSQFVHSDTGPIRYWTGS
jgi:uncharacterized protein YcbK (DUF882 family)